MILHPKRIACLSAESADWLCRIGAWDRVVGVTAFFKQPADVAPKPKISGFSSANINAIIDLNPDLIITFSDVQAELAAGLIKRGLNVLATNQRTLTEIENTLAMLSRVVGHGEQGDHVLADFRKRLAPVEQPPQRPRVYFEEWNNPLVSGISWVSELIERAGGVDVFAERKNLRAAADRTVSVTEVAEQNPDVILASWCGTPVDVSAIANRPGWDSIHAVNHDQIHEIPSDDILQPGFRLIQGFEQIQTIIATSKTPS